MFREWSIDLLRLIFVAVAVVIAAVISTDIYLASAVVMPVILALLVLDRKPGKIESVDLNVPEKAWVGEPMDVYCRVRSTVPGTVLNLELVLPPQFEIIRGSNVHIFYVGRKQRDFDFRMKLMVLRRGEYAIERLRYTSHSMGGGLRRSTGSIELNRKVEVIPRVQVMKRKNIKTFSRKFVPRQSTARIGPPSTEFDSVRNYSHGDPVKSINWKATARNPGGNTLLVNRYEREGMSTSLIVLDRAGYMKKGSLDTNPFESGIRAILSLSRLLLDRRINTGFWYGQAFGRRRGYVMPSTDMGNYQLIKKTLIYGEPLEAVKVEINPGKLFYDSLRATGANVLIMTNITPINVESLSNFIKYTSRMASKILVMDILPYGIISRIQESGIAELYGEAILRKSNSRIYREVPKNARIISWDPEVERMSGVLTKIAGFLR